MPCPKGVNISQEKHLVYTFVWLLLLLLFLLLFIVTSIIAITSGNDLGKNVEQK